MNSEQRQEVLRLTQSTIEGIWSRNFHTYDRVAEKMITGVGAYESEHITGKDEVKMELLKRSAEYPPIYVDGLHFEIVSDDISSSVVAGEYYLYARKHLIVEQRVTAVWIVKRKRLKLHYIQFTDVKKNLNGPQHEYTRALRQQREQQSVVPVRDHEGHLYMLEPADIEWVQANRNYILIHRADYDEEDLKVRAVFTDFVDQLPSQFLIVSRGKLINMDYVETFSADKITLIDGTEFRVSRGCRDEVEDKMQKIHFMFEDIEQ